MEFWEGGSSQIGWFDTQKAKAIGDLQRESDEMLRIEIQNRRRCRMEVK